MTKLVPDGGSYVVRNHDGTWVDNERLYRMMVTTPLFQNKPGDLPPLFPGTWRVSDRSRTWHYGWYHRSRPAYQLGGIPSPVLPLELVSDGDRIVVLPDGVWTVIAKRRIWDELCPAKAWLTEWVSSCVHSRKLVATMYANSKGYPKGSFEDHVAAVRQRPMMGDAGYPHCYNLGFILEMLDRHAKGDAYKEEMLCPEPLMWDAVKPHLVKAVVAEACAYFRMSGTKKGSK